MPASLSCVRCTPVLRLWSAEGAHAMPVARRPSRASLRAGVRRREERLALRLLLDAGELHLLDDHGRRDDRGARRKTATVELVVDGRRAPCGEDLAQVAHVERSELAAAHGLLVTVGHVDLGQVERIAEHAAAALAALATPEGSREGATATAAGTAALDRAHAQRELEPEILRLVEQRLLQRVGVAAVLGLDLETGHGGLRMPRA